jgi:hypothetical protein
MTIYRRANKNVYFIYFNVGIEAWADLGGGFRGSADLQLIFVDEIGLLEIFSIFRS